MQDYRIINALAEPFSLLGNRRWSFVVKSYPCRMQVQHNCPMKKANNEWTRKCKKIEASPPPTLILTKKIYVELLNLTS